MNRLRRTLLILLATLALAGAAAGVFYLLRNLGVVRPEPKARKELPTKDILVLDLYEDAVRAEFVADTPKFVFGTDEGKAHYEEADLRYHGDAEGWISWRHEAEKVDCALLAGGRGAFRLNCFDAGKAALELKAVAVEGGDEARAPMRVFLNGMLLGEEGLPRGRKFFTLRFDIPDGALKRGENRFEVEVDEGVEFTPPGMPFPIRLSGFFLSAALEGVSGPGHSFKAVKGSGEEVDLLLPSGTELAFYHFLDGRERLKTGLIRRGGDLEASVWITTPNDPPAAIFKATLFKDNPMLPVDLDLSDYAGKPCRIALRAGELGSESPNRFVLWKAPRLVRTETIDSAGEPSEGDEVIPNPWAGEKPNIAVVLMDAASAFFFTPLAGDVSAVPAAEAFAKDAVLFEKAVAPAPYTLPSVGSILTGRLPDRHGVVYHANREGVNLKLSKDVPCLASELKQRGYATFGVVTNPNAAGLYGYSKGFDRYEELFKDPALWHEGIDPMKAVERAKALIAENKDAPYFLYLHLFQPHAPYRPPHSFVSRFADPGYGGPADGSRAAIDGFKEKGSPPFGPEDFEHLKNLYKANLAFVDQAVGEFLNWLRESGHYDETMIVLCSDHGEAFGEHRSIEHGHHLYEEALRIPLVIKYPHNRCSGGRVKEAVSLTDLAPTLGAMGGVPEGLLDRDGMDITEAIIDPVLLSDRVHIARSDVFKPSFSLRWRGYQFIHDSLNRREELYFVSEDVRQREDLKDSRPILAGYLRARLCRLLCEIMAEEAGEALKLDEEFIQSVQGIGYTGGGATGSASHAGCPLVRRRQ